MNGSPLGKYAAPAAAIASLTIILVCLIGLLFGAAIGVTPEAQSKLDLLAAIAAGALFGSSVAVNGYKAPLEDAHRRIDSLQRAAAGNRAGVIAAGAGGDVPSAIIAAEAAEKP